MGGKSERGIFANFEGGERRDLSGCAGTLEMRFETVRVRHGIWWRFFRELISVLMSWIEKGKYANDARHGRRGHESSYYWTIEKAGVFLMFLDTKHRPKSHDTR